MRGSTHKSSINNPLETFRMFHIPSQPGHDRMPAKSSKDKSDTAEPIGAIPFWHPVCRCWMQDGSGRGGLEEPVEDEDEDEEEGREGR